jgi:orotate phosphoribosyltransferase-like protein
MNGPLAPEKVARIQEMRRNGARVLDIARECRVSESVVIKYCDGIAKPKGNRKMPPLQKVQQLIRCGFTCQDIAEDYNVCASTVRDYLTKAAKESSHV